MYTTLIVIGLIIVVVVAGVLIIAATKPNTFRLERSASINAPPARVYALIDDFKQWRSWSPWEKLDPDLKRTYSGAASGLGAVYAWEGNNKVGQGRMEIIESVPPSRVVIKLDSSSRLKPTTRPYSRSSRAGRQPMSIGQCRAPIYS